MKYIKHDEGYDYGEEKIRELDTEVTEVFEDIQRWFDFEIGRYTPDTEGVSRNLSGRETSEIRQSWRESKRIDFTGKKIASVKDLAEMFSVYRNNAIESFHLIYVDDQNNILAHNALSSGLPGFSIGIDSRTAERSLYRMERLGQLDTVGAQTGTSGNLQNLLGDNPDW